MKSAPFSSLAAFALLASFSFQGLDAQAVSSGYTGRTLRDSASGCGGCHGSPSTMTVVITGPTALNAGQLGNYTVTATKAVGNGTRMGVAVATSDTTTTLAIGAGMPMNTTAAPTQELYHSNGVGALRTTTGNSANYTFTYTMPGGAAVGSSHTIYATAVLAYTGEWQHATNLLVYTRPNATASATASGPTSSTMNLSWTGGGPEYRVVYKAGAVAPVDENDGTNAYQNTGTSTTVSGLAASTQYTFRVFSKLSGQNIFATAGASATATTSASASVTRHVNVATGSNTSNNCTNIASPCKTITYAMAQANVGSPGDLVAVAGGTYNVFTGEVFPIAMKSGVQLYATGAATIDGAGDTVKQGLIVSTGNASNVTRIQGFTITNGLTTVGQGGSALGGAIRVSSATATVSITNNTFLRNEVRGYTADGSLGQTGGLAWGGAIQVFSSPVDILNNVFIGNVARGGNGLDHPLTAFTGNEYGGTGEGGAIYYGSGAGTITNNTFHLNRAIGGNGGLTSTTRGVGSNAIGGAVTVPGNPAPSINNNIFVRNSAEGGQGSTLGTGTAGALSFGVSVANKNLFYGNQQFGVAGSGDNDGTLPLNNTDPQFHAAPMNLRVRTGSPATGQGIATGNSNDFDYQARPGTPTMGAFEPTAVGGVAADLSVAQTPVTSGATASTYKDQVHIVTVTNNGPNAAAGVTLFDVLPAAAQFVWASQGCTFSAGSVMCAVGTLASGASAQYKIVVRPPVSGTANHRNYVSVGGAVNDTGQSLAAANNLNESVINVAASPVAAQVLRYRLYSPVTLEHHFTTDLNEYTVLGTFVGTWVQEGTVGKVLNNPGHFNGVIAVPYYRLYDNGTQWHHWTTDANEYYTLGEFPSWTKEGVDGWILLTNTAGATELYRLLYPFVGGLHHWTTDPVEYNQLITNFGWIGEPGAGYVVQ